MQTQRGHARWLRETKNAHFVFPVLDNQPTLFDHLDALTWTGVPITAWNIDNDRGRHELRTIQALPAPPGLRFPHIAQVFLIERTLRIDQPAPNRRITNIAAALRYNARKNRRILKLLQLLPA